MSPNHEAEESDWISTLLIVFNGVQYGAILLSGFDYFILLVPASGVLFACCKYTRKILGNIVPDPRPWIIKAVTLAPVSVLGLFYLEAILPLNKYVPHQAMSLTSLLLLAAYSLFPLVGLFVPFALMIVVATFQQRQRESEPHE